MNFMLFVREIGLNSIAVSAGYLQCGTKKPIKSTNLYYENKYIDLFVLHEIFVSLYKHVVNMFMSEFQGYFLHKLKYIPLYFAKLFLQ